MTPEEFRIALIWLHLTQKALAEETGLHPRTVNRYASGDRKVPKLVEAYLDLRLKQTNDGR
jgi:transcriptional regulator with XRE-family HTH domain